MKTLTAACSIGLLALAGQAHADATSECLQASEKAQSLRDDHKLIEARAQFLACAKDTCPGAVRKDCADQVSDMDKRTPTVVIHAKDASGQDLVAVHVTSDGKPLTDQLTGQAVTLNPGVHTFHFEAPGQPPVDQQVVLGEGQKDRDITVTLGTPAGGGGGGGVVAPPPKKGVPVGGIVLGVVGLVGIGVGSAFYVSGFNQKSNDEKTCAPAAGNAAGCPQSEIDSIHNQLIAGDIAFYTGVALLGVGIIWTIVHYASGPSHKEGAQTATFGVSPTALGHGATASALIRF